MIEKKEREIIESRFKKLIRESKISKPKPNKKDFFKHKAEESLNLAKELLGRQEHLDWAINTAYYSMYYNAVSLLAHINVDLGQIDESVHTLTYQALVYYFHILNSKIEAQYLEDFKSSMEESDLRLKTLAKNKSEEILASYKKAKEDRGKITYELGQIAEVKSAKAALQRAEAFDILAEKLMI